ncbi:hypothetical protein HDZ31DRAFT_64011 [Schizophyllum fasciatum]
MGTSSRKPPSRSGRRKGRSAAQRASLQRAQTLLHSNGGDSENIDPSGAISHPSISKNQGKPASTVPLADHRRLLDNSRRTIRRRDRKLAKEALIAQKKVHELSDEIKCLKTTHNIEMREANSRLSDAAQSLQEAKETIARLERVISEQAVAIQALKTKLYRCRKSLNAANKRSARNSPLRQRQKEARIRERAVQQCLRDRIFCKGAYRPEVRALMRELMHAGCSQKKAGAMLLEFGRLVGINLNAAGLRCPSARTITSSSDSTSFRNEDYESKCLALKALGSDGELSDEHVVRAMSVDASLDHASTSQVAGFLASLERKFQVFNDSPYAKRRGLFASFQAFALVYKGTNGDHANDVKKDHKLLLAWKMVMTKTYLGNEYLRTLEPQPLLRRIVPFARAAIVEVGGFEAWAQLSVDEWNRRNVRVMEALAQSLGEELYEAKSEEEKLKLSRFLWAGCCMHKEL